MIINFLITNWIEILGALFGLLYLYYEYKADMKMWPTGIFMSSFYIFVFVHAKFYAFAGINLYYIIVGAYGWIKWSKSSKSISPVDFSLMHTPTRLYIYIFISIFVIFCLIAYILSIFTDSQVVYGDSFVTTLSIVAMWMLAHKYIEQWLLLIVLNIVSTFLYLYQDLYPTSIMYFIYAIVSIFGYIRWRKLANN